MEFNLRLEESPRVVFLVSSGNCAVGHLAVFTQWKPQMNADRHRWRACVVELPHANLRSPSSDRLERSPETLLFLSLSVFICVHLWSSARKPGFTQIPFFVVFEFF